MEENKKEIFNYTYSAKQQEEIKNIREKYAGPQDKDASESKMEQLRKLDQGVTRKATTVSLIVGITGALVMGLGMSLTMTELGAVFGPEKTFSMMGGIIIGLAGMVCVCCAYPLYNATLKKERKKVAPEILRLTDELLK